VASGQREEEGAGGEEEEAGRMVRVNGHHLKLYSDLVGRLCRAMVSVGFGVRWLKGEGEQQIPHSTSLRAGSSGMTKRKTKTTSDSFAPLLNLAAASVGDCDGL
jgi:hypothetical protein